MDIAKCGKHGMDSIHVQITISMELTVTLYLK